MIPFFISMTFFSMPKWRGGRAERRKGNEKGKEPVGCFNLSAGFREPRDNGKKGSHAKCVGCCSRPGTPEATWLSDGETRGPRRSRLLARLLPRGSREQGPNLQPLASQSFSRLLFLSKPNVLNDNSGTRLARSGLGGGGRGRDPCVLPATEGVW